MLIVETCRKTERNAGADLVSLSARDLELAQLVSRGSQNKEIAGLLGITEGTVKVYISHLFAKLGLLNRADLAAWAVRHDAQIRMALGAEAEERKNLAARSRSRSRFWKLFAGPQID